jgi:aryl-alcohol dehydrogenase-like predicted oxidoreductase
MADRGGTVRYETIQNNFSLVNRRFEDELATVCRREHVSLLPYSPLAGGVLSGKYAGGAWPPGARFSRYRDHSPRTQAMTRRFLGERVQASVARVHEIARGCGIAPVTFAVAWTLTRDFVGSTLVGVTDPAQLDEHLAAAEVKIPGDALEACDRLAREIPYPLG